MSDQFSSLLEGPRQFARESTQLVQRCTKPDRREFFKIGQAVLMGFVLMGLIGYLVKLVNIPINSIIMG